MRINRSLLNWGVFLIALGGIPLAVDQGWIDAEMAGDLGQLWPLILVGIGLGLILRWTPISWFGGALVAATFGIIFGAAVVAIPDDVSDLQGIIPAVASGACSGESAGPESTTERGVASRTAFALDVSLSCGELGIDRAATADWGLEAAHDTGDAPRVDESELDGETTAVRLSQSAGNDISFLGTQAQSDWRLEVPAAAALSISSTLNAVKGEIDTGTGPIARLEGTFNASDVLVDLASATTSETGAIDLTLNASDANLLLPDGDIRAGITLTASSLRVCMPQAAAVRIENSSLLSSDDLGSSGLTERTFSVWTTPGFDTATDRIDISLTSTVSSFSIERPESCS